MRDAARKMAEKHFSDRTTEHVEFLPVEWRSKLSLDGGEGEDHIQLNFDSFLSVCFLAEWFSFIFIDVMRCAEIKPM